MPMEFQTRGITYPHGITCPWNQFQTASRGIIIVGSATKQYHVIQKQTSPALEEKIQAFRGHRPHIFRQPLREKTLPTSLSRKMPVNNPNVGVAFALVCGAGAATALGASVVFFPRLVKLASRRVLAGALGVSAGVMTYVSFVEIFNKSQSSFLDAGHSEKNAYLYATLCFFAGVVVMLVSRNRSIRCAGLLCPPRRTFLSCPLLPLLSSHNSQIQLHTSSLCT